MGLDFRIELLHAPAFRVAFSSLSRPSSEHDASHHLHLGDPADLPKSLQCARTRRHTVREAWPANVEEIRSSTETQAAQRRSWHALDMFSQVSWPRIRPRIPPQIQVDPAESGDAAASRGLHARQ